MNRCLSRRWHPSATRTIPDSRSCSACRTRPTRRCTPSAACARAFPWLTSTSSIDPAQHGVNRKISNLINMYPRAKHDLLVMADSDIHARHGTTCATSPSQLSRPGVGLVTTLYAPASGSSDTMAARLGAAQINHSFLPGRAAGALARPRGLPGRHHDALDARDAGARWAGWRRWSTIWRTTPCLAGWCSARGRDGGAGGNDSPPDDRAGDAAARATCLQHELTLGPHHPIPGAGRVRAVSRPVSAILGGWWRWLFAGLAPWAIALFFGAIWLFRASVMTGDRRGTLGLLDGGADLAVAAA